MASFAVCCTVSVHYLPRPVHCEAENTMVNRVTWHVAGPRGTQSHASFCHQGAPASPEANRDSKGEICNQTLQDERSLLAKHLKQSSNGRKPPNLPILFSKVQELQPILLTNQMDSLGTPGPSHNMLGVRALHHE